MITGICCLNLIFLAEGADKLIYLNYIVASTTQIYIYSIGGNMLVESSTNVQRAAYNFEWYKCDIKIRKLIHLMIVRSQRKTAIDVPFFEASLQTFANIFQAAGGYITLAKAFL
jgi:gustatory receptor